MGRSSLARYTTLLFLFFSIVNCSQVKGKTTVPANQPGSGVSNLVQAPAGVATTNTVYRPLNYLQL